MNKTILVVDDDPGIGKLITMALQRAGHTVHAVTSGLESLEKTKAVNYDLAFLDMMMPEMDGVETLKFWRTAGKTFPVVVITGYCALAELEEASAIYNTSFLPKPFSIKVLQECADDNFSIDVQKQAA